METIFYTIIGLAIIMILINQVALLDLIRRQRGQIRELKESLTVIGYRLEITQAVQSNMAESITELYLDREITDCIQ